jgi:hypothetical protein
MMAVSYSNAARQAALTAVSALLNGGRFRVLTSGDVELAAPTFQATSYSGVTAANPAVATFSTLSADTSITTDATFAKFEMQTSAPANVITGSIGVGAGFDIQVASATIPATATSFNISGLTISLSLA